MGLEALVGSSVAFDTGTSEADVLGVSTTVDAGVGSSTSFFVASAVTSTSLVVDSSSLRFLSAKKSKNKVSEQTRITFQLLQ